jgi:hypothetical protein
MDGGTFALRQRHLLQGNLANGNLADIGIDSSPLLLNQTAFVLWLEQQIRAGEVRVELTGFRCVVEYPDCWANLILMKPRNLWARLWSHCLVSARCPVCEVAYGTAELREVEYNLCFSGEYVLVCPQDHHLFVLGWELYQLGG